MAELTQVGAFCPNPECADYGQLQLMHQANIIRFGLTKAGRQRYQCKTCRADLYGNERHALLSSPGRRERDSGSPGPDCRRQSDQ